MSKIKEDIEKRGKFKGYIEELSKLSSLSNEQTNEYLNLFEELYKEQFRHFYSDILIVLLKLDKGTSDQTTLVLEQLPANLQLLYKEAIKKEKKCSKQLVKLYDHCVMDCSRIKYWKEQDKSYQDFCNNTSVQVSEKFSLLEKIKNDFNNNIQEMKEYNTNFQKDKEILTNETDEIKKETKEVKKDLVSIMGIFLGIFLFFQLNFSQIKDLLEYDPFSRMIYLIMFNVIFLVGLYLIFVIIDFLIHREPRLLKLIINTEKKKPNMLGWVCIILYIGILGTCGKFLYSGNSRKTISKIENSIEESNESLNKKIVNEIKKKNVEINILKEKITELENQIKEINKNDTKLEKNTKIKQD
ncbi:hypothetical protein FNCP11_05090 [Fusobacterium nucleatum]|nr:hypothetical protein FNCP11_05090 [Fusobacterium nucleatum]BEP09585.1 hypothetical protein FNSP11_04290 [Fusobacterium nucleatum]